MEELRFQIYETVGVGKGKLKRDMEVFGDVRKKGDVEVLFYFIFWIGHVELCITVKKKLKQ